MIRCFKFLVCTLAISIVVAEYNPPPFVRGRPRKGLVNHWLYTEDAAIKCDPANGDTTEDKYLVLNDTITQYVDHFNGSNKATWKQRYQYNSKFFDPHNATVFLMLGGESPIFPGGQKWITCENITMMQWAKEFRAAAFQLEHRFYGPSEYTPFGNQNTENLKYFTVDQALADIKEFINQMNQKYFANVTKPIWITFGGSYPGSLSAWFRETYPEMTAGAVSTSSAVNLFVDYYGYAVNTEKIFREINNTCADNVKTAFTQIINRVYNGAAERRQLVTDFNLCSNFTETAITKAAQFFLQNLYGYFQGYTQYTGDNRDNTSRYCVSVEIACGIMNNASEPDLTKRLINVLNHYDQCVGSTGCRTNSYADFISYSRNSSSKDGEALSNRGWLWQTCTELGYYQTTDGGNGGMFGSSVPLDFFSDQCIDIFGPSYTLDNTFKWVDAVRTKYGGGDSYKGTKVVFPNGSYDPWQSLGYTKSDNQSDIDAFLIEGTAHCADMYAPSANDKASLVDARKRIHNHLAKWINDAQIARTQGSASSTIFCGLIIAIIAIMNN